MITELLILVASIAVLSKSASMAVDNALKLSNFFRIGQLAIGFVLLAATTTLPELSVSVVSSTAGEGAIAAGNVFGSNIANILLILGLGAFLFKLKISAPDLRWIWLVLLLTTLLSAYVIFNGSVQEKALGFFEGVVLIGIFVLHIWYSVTNRKPEQDGNNAMISKHEALGAFLFFGLSVMVVIISSGFVVGSAVKLADTLGIAESFIGATIIAVGTSLPEMSVCIQAIRKKHYGLALGDAIGSNMTNITLVLGTAALINPIHVNLAIFIAALLFAVISNMLLLYLGAVHKKLTKEAGMLFLAIYAVYLITIFMLQVHELG
jgi:cation:H+ antiporter